MAQVDIHQPSKIYRGTIDEVFSHRNEISPGATVELKVVEEKTTPAQSAPALDERARAAIALLDSWITEGEAADEKTRLEAIREVEEFKSNMNANRAATGERPVYP